MASTSPRSSRPALGRSDLYAVGIVRWELLASRRLRAGLPGDTSATITFTAIQPPSEHRPVPADLEAVAMRLLAYFREERYPTAELAARDLVCCQDASRDGRGDLVRLLDERFPRARRPGPFPIPLEPGSQSTSRRTVTGPWQPMGVPLAPLPEWQQDGPRLAGTSDPSRQRRRWALAFVVLVLVLGTTLSLLVLR